MRFFNITCCLFLVVISSSAQNDWINYTNNYFGTDIEELKGGIWLSSSGGLCYVDTATGKETYYNRGNSNIRSNTVYDILFHPDKDLWVTTSEGLCIWRDGQFINGPDKLKGVLRLTPDKKIVIANYDSLYIQTSGMNFESIAYPDYAAEIGGIEISENGTIYINVINYFGETYVAEYEDNNWEILFSEFIYKSSLTMDSKDRLWFFYSEGLYYWENDSWVQAISIDSLNGFNLGKLHVDVDDNIIIEIHNDCPQLLVWDGMTLNQLDFVKGDCRACRFIKPSIKQKDTYFASNIEQGYYQFNSMTKEDFKKYSQSQLYHNHILTTLHPADGSHFIVYFNAIQKIENEVWSQISLPEDLTKNIRFSSYSNGKIYISDAENIWFYEGAKWKKHKLPTRGFLSEIELMYIGDDETLWIQYGTYLARYKEDWQVYGTGQHDITNSIIKDMVVDPKNRDLWVSTFQGVRHFDGNSWHKYNFPPVDHAFSLAVANEGTYVHTSGLYFIHNGIIDSIPMPPVGYYGSFESEMIYDRKKERLYLSGTNHLAVLENDDWEVYNLNNSGVYNGYSNDVKIDNDGNLWLSGSVGGLEIFNANGVISSINDTNEKDQFENKISVYPTLLHSRMIHIKSIKGGVFDIALIGINGKLLSHHKISLPSYVEVPYQLIDCPVGMYFLSITDERGFTTKQFISVNH